MTTLLGCIADDFTGATDIAGLLARSGVRVSLRIGVPSGAVSDPAPFEVIALKSRTAPVSEAVDQATAALNWLRAAGTQRFFWKYCSTFDSTDQGNIGPVSEALMRALDIDQTIYCPAFPENGRTVFMGNLFVGQQPLAECPMKDHPLTPMRDSNLMRLLTPQVKGRVGLIDRLEVARGAANVRDRLKERRKEGAAHVVVDAVAKEDLETIATACQDMALLTGGSALAMPLPALYAQAGLLDATAPGLSVPRLGEAAVVLSGSCSAMTRMQVENYIARGAPAYQLDPLDLHENGPARAMDWITGQDLVEARLIYATAEPETVRKAQEALGVAGAGEVVENALAQCAVAAREAGVQRFVVAGGETSGAVTQALGVDQLDIGPEIAPGVPWTFTRSEGRDIALALKSGNFGHRDFFSAAFSVLQGLERA